MAAAERRDATRRYASRSKKNHMPRLSLANMTASVRRHDVSPSRYHATICLLAELSYRRAHIHIQPFESSPARHVWLLATPAQSVPPAAARMPPPPLTFSRHFATANARHCRQRLLFHERYAEGH